MDDFDKEYVKKNLLRAFQNQKTILSFDPICRDTVDLDIIRNSANYTLFYILDVMQYMGILSESDREDMGE